MHRKIEKTNETRFQFPRRITTHGIWIRVDRVVVTKVKFDVLRPNARLQNVDRTKRLLNRPVSAVHGAKRVSV